MDAVARLEASEHVLAPKTECGRTSAAFWLALVAAGATFAVCVRVALHSAEVGSIAGQWIYPYFREFSPWLVLPAVGSLLLLLVVRGALALTARGREWAGVAVVTLAGFAIQLLLRVFSLAPLGAIVASARADGFYWTARRVSALRFLTDHERLSQMMPDHVRTNMPGKLLLYKLLLTLSTVPRSLGFMIALLSVLGGVLVYLVTRELTDDRRGGLFAMTLYLLMPGRIVFLPILNTVTPIVILLPLWLFLLALRRNSLTMSAAFGASLYLLAFFEPLPLVMGLVFVALLYRALMHDNGRAYLKQGAAAVGAFFVLYAVVRLATTYDLLANLNYVIRDAGSFNTEKRDYLIWLGANLTEFALAAGVATTIVFLGGFGDAEWRSSRSAIGLFAIACLVTILVVDLLGLNRGEVSRLWIFMASFLAVPAGARLATTRSMLPFAIVVVALAAQTAIEAGMLAFVIP